MHLERLKCLAIAERDLDVDAPVGVVTLAVNLELARAAEARKRLGELDTGLFNEDIERWVKLPADLVDAGVHGRQPPLQLRHDSLLVVQLTVSSNSGAKQLTCFERRWWRWTASALTPTDASSCAWMLASWFWTSSIDGNVCRQIQ